MIIFQEPHPSFPRIHPAPKSDKSQFDLVFLSLLNAEEKHFHWESIMARDVLKVASVTATAVAGIGG
jgi:hypothetical protein